MGMEGMYLAHDRDTWRAPWRRS